jgi:hypothetical protein
VIIEKEAIIIIESAVLLAITVIVHEFGHYMMAKIFGYNPRFIFHGKNRNPAVIYQRCNDRKDTISIGLSGIISGYVTLFMLLNMNLYAGDIFDKLIIVLGYTLGYYSDFTQILFKNGRELFKN